MYSLSSDHTVSSFLLSQCFPQFWKRCSEYYYNSRWFFFQYCGLYSVYFHCFWDSSQCRSVLLCIFLQYRSIRVVYYPICRPWTLFSILLTYLSQIFCCTVFVKHFSWILFQLHFLWLYNIGIVDNYCKICVQKRLMLSQLLPFI